MLITYSDSIGSNLKELYEVLTRNFKGAVGGIHILPFFPSSGDRGFAPITYDVVDPAFGDWDDITKFSEEYYLMCDYKINHMSAQSEIYQKKLEEQGVWTYDFQLPFLILNAVHFGRTMYLKNWLKICPRKQFTTLDTHDGIGVVDARYLMPDEEVLETKRAVFDANPDINEIYKDRQMRVNFSKFDTYQIACTYYDALGSEDDRYLIARAVQFFAPGIPMVYYVGLFAGRNDFDFYHQSKQGRDINRHYYTLPEIEEEMKRPVVQKMYRLMCFRNSHEAFNGEFRLLTSDEHSLHIRWEKGAAYAELFVDFEKLTYDIRYTEDGKVKRFE